MMIETVTKDTPKAYQILERATFLLNQALQTTIIHFENNKIKCSCGIDIGLTLKDDDVSVKITPKTNLPMNSEELSGELTEQGLEIIE